MELFKFIAVAMFIAAVGKMFGMVGMAVVIAALALVLSAMSIRNVSRRY